MMEPQTISPADPMAQARQRFKPMRTLLAAAASAIPGLLASAMPHAARAEAYVPFPSQDSLRQVQLGALACARENTAASCDQARKLADPLLDHPRLPAACKDQLWTISQKAVPAPQNSYSRREAIGQPAQLLLLSCRSSETAAPAPAAAPPGSGGGGLKFGGSGR
jgi:hypothetical protein